MPFNNGEPVTVRLSDLKSIPSSMRKPGTVRGRILQRCGPESYDVLLDSPLSSELTLLSWVPETSISPIASED